MSEQPQECSHDLAEQETACADGMCPICLKAQLSAERDRAEGCAHTIEVLEDRLADITRQRDDFRRALEQRVGEADALTCKTISDNQ